MSREKYLEHHDPQPLAGDGTSSLHRGARNRRKLPPRWGANDVSARCSAIEECYEFMLAYAGQGLSGKENSQASSQVREFLNRAVAGDHRIGRRLCRAVREENLQPAERYLAYLAVLERDARDLPRYDSAGSRAGHDQLATDR